MTTRFASKLKKIRKQYKLSQYVLAHRLKVSQGYISLLESGQRPPSDAIVEKIDKTYKTVP